MSKTRQGDDLIPITAADMERFHKNAWAAIRRRDAASCWDEIGTGLRAVFLGAVPLLGILWWNWSALELLVFFIVGSVVAILCDFAKLYCLETKIRQWGDAFYEDWHVWVVVDALRVGERHAVKAFLRAKYEPWSGVFVDFVFGGISTILIVVGLARSPEGIAWSELNDRGMLLWLCGVVTYQVALTAWEIWEHRSGQAADRQVKVAVGLRGVGLFIFMFILVGVTDGFEHVGVGVKRAMLAVNGAVVLWGLGTMCGPLLTRKETAWLRAYMEKRDAENL